MRLRKLVMLAAAGILTLQIPLSAMANVSVNGKDTGKTEYEITGNMAAEESEAAVSLEEGDTVTGKGDITVDKEDSQGITNIGGSVEVTSDITGAGIYSTGIRNDTDE